MYTLAHFFRLFIAQKVNLKVLKKTLTRYKQLANFPADVFLVVRELNGPLMMAKLRDEDSDIL